MAAEKKCSKCGWKLRADNTKGICGTASACKRRVDSGWKPADDDAGDDVLDRTSLPKTPPKTKSDALKRFRAVAEAMGHDPDELLAQYCEGWLLAVKEAVDKVQNGGG